MTYLEFWLTGYTFSLGFCFYKRPGNFAFNLLLLLCMWPFVVGFELRNRLDDLEP